MIDLLLTANLNDSTLNNYLLKPNVKVIDFFILNQILSLVRIFVSNYFENKNISVGQDKAIFHDRN